MTPADALAAAAGALLSEISPTSSDLEAFSCQVCGAEWHIPSEVKHDSYCQWEAAELALATYRASRGETEAVDEEPAMTPDLVERRVVVEALAQLEGPHCECQRCEWFERTLEAIETVPAFAPDVEAAACKMHELQVPDNPASGHPREQWDRLSPGSTSPWIEQARAIIAAAMGKGKL